MAFEVQLLTEGRWLAEVRLAKELDAVGLAQEKLDTNLFEAVRVIEERPARNGFMHERVVFEETRLGSGQRPIKAASVDDAAVCEAVEDLYRLPARLTIGRVLRHYLDHHGLTPSEMLISPGLLRQIQRRDNLLSQAMGIVAGAQARLMEQSTSARLEALHGLFEALESRLRHASEFDAHADILRTEGLDGLMRALRDQAPPSRQRIGVGALAHLLGDSLDWSVKIEALLAKLEEARHPDAATLVDDMLAEILDNLDAVRALLGRRPDLADAARTVVRLADGTYTPEPGDPDLLARVNALIGAYEMPKLRAALHDWLDRAIRSTQPLTKEGKREDKRAFATLLGDLVRDEGLAGGPPISEAVTQRARSVLSDKPDEQRVETAIDALMRMIAPAGTRLGYLLDLNETPTGARAPESVFRHMATVIRDVPTLTALAGDRPGRLARQAGDRFLARLHDAAMPDELKVTFSQRIEGLKKRHEAGDTRPFEPGEMGEIPNPGAGDRALGQIAAKAGKVLFREGDPGDHAYLVRDGKVEVLVEFDGKPVSIAIVERGAILGEMALIDDEPRMASAIVKEDATLTVIPAEKFKARLARLEENDPVMRRLLDVFVDRIRVMTKRKLS